jgi:hypothetical protein
VPLRIGWSLSDLNSEARLRSTPGPEFAIVKSQEVRHMNVKHPTIRKTLTVLMTSFVLLSGIPAIAQIETRVTFQAPFAFFAGNAKMPAGDYTITVPDMNSDLLLIESADRSHSAFVDYVPVDSSAPASSSAVTFNQYGTANFLNTISVEGQESGMQLVVSKVELNAAKAARAVKHSLAARTGR